MAIFRCYRCGREEAERGERSPGRRREQQAPGEEQEAPRGPAGVLALLDGRGAQGPHRARP